MKSAEENVSLVEASSNMGFPAASATMLILFGIVFQVAEIACRNLHSGNLWLLSVLISDIWNILSMRFSVPPLGEILLYWPVVMICLGLAILLAAQENQPPRERRR